MNKNKAVVVLLIIAILFSVATIAIALGIDFSGSGVVPAVGGQTVSGGSGTIGLEILPSGGSG